MSDNPFYRLPLEKQFEYQRLSASFDDFSEEDKQAAFDMVLKSYFLQEDYLKEVLRTNLGIDSF